MNPFIADTIKHHFLFQLFRVNCPAPNYSAPARVAPTYSLLRIRHPHQVDFTLCLYHLEGNRIVLLQAEILLRRFQ